ncbi:MAG: phosphoribosyltransferase [Armatimonadota bacterium]
MQVFEDRADAGKKLAKALEQYQGTDALVIAVPRGGVVVGYEIAAALDLKLDVVVPRKLGAPDQPELAIGAVAPWNEGNAILDEHAISYLGVTQDYIQKETERQLIEINRRLREYRGTIDPPNISGRTVIVVDDGIATGYTIEAALHSLRKLNPGRIILAVPVAAPDSLWRISRLVDEVHVLMTPTPFFAVGSWYIEFGQTSDEEVIELLNARRMQKA